MSQPSLSDRASGHIPWRLNELEIAATTLEMDLTAIFAPVDDDLELSLFEPLDGVVDDVDDVMPADPGRPLTGPACLRWAPRPSARRSLFTSPRRVPTQDDGLHFLRPPLRAQRHRHARARDPVPVPAQERAHIR